MLLGPPHIRPDGLSERKLAIIVKAINSCEVNIHRGLSWKTSRRGRERHFSSHFGALLNFIISLQLMS